MGPYCLQNEPASSGRYKFACVLIKDSNQSVHANVHADLSLQWMHVYIELYFLRDNGSYRLPKGYSEQMTDVVNEGKGVKGVTFGVMLLTHKAPPIICSRRQCQNLLLFQKKQIRQDIS